MKRKISIYSKKSSNYIFANFLKQYKKALQNYSIGEMLSSHQILNVLNFMGFVQQQPTVQQVSISRTITSMLSESPSTLAVRRGNLFQFLLVLCDIQQIKQSAQSSFFQQQISGLAMDADRHNEQPMIIIQLGKFDENGRWSCSESEKKQIRTIFESMKSKRISRNEVQARKKSLKAEQPYQTFQPKINPKSNQIAVKLIKKAVGKENGFFGNRVQDRLLISRQKFQAKIKQQLDRSIERELGQCTFKPTVKSLSQSKQNLSLKSNSQTHLNQLFYKGKLYQERREKLKQLKIHLNQSVELQDCTFKPQTTKYSQSNKWVYVRNRDKQIERLRQGRKYRQFMNTVKERGYPNGVNWSQFIWKKANNQMSKEPVLHIDLKISNKKYTVNVFQGENVPGIVQRIGKQYKIPESMWARVQQLINNSLENCNDIRIENKKIISQK